MNEAKLLTFYDQSRFSEITLLDTIERERKRQRQRQEIFVVKGK